MSDIHQMTTPLGEIALADALSYIDRLRAEVYRARSERDALIRKAKAPCVGQIPGASVLLGDVFIHVTSGRKHSVASIHTEPTQTTFLLVPIPE